ncbi:hypothetical protein NEOLI_001399 [Neolecta irregularis DAH-3]|uniref:NYN domain-containing protein n=1 Tax=Neolecta irregularis (strain DAH-3) TaxID=1198029 RepID=A0A1U7LHP5_NEOID|nr:hypothetical protein NEOLI_001399 [Neolecta irregularis DAH-3]|eukprot:OLL22176.1 hypothetical protein NEOLI_001399 [Neolecta irregularis DAH-3]
MSHEEQLRGLGDFDHLFDLIRCLPNELPSQSSHHSVKEGLGNFDVVWRYLDAIHPESQSSSLKNIEYKSDDRALVLPTKKEPNTQSLGKKRLSKKPRVTSFDRILYNTQQPGVQPTKLAVDAYEGLRKERKQYRREDKGYRSDGYETCFSNQQHSTKTATPPFHGGKSGKDLVLGEIALNTAQKMKTQTTSSLDRVRTLTTKLVETFPDEDSVILGSPAGVTDIAQVDHKVHTNKTMLPYIAATGNSLHVFIDSSNILIGFLNKVKGDHGLANSGRFLRRPRLDFHALLQLLSRGRDVTRKVLVASSPLLQPIEEAQTLGFETSILQRVTKSVSISRGSKSDPEQATGRKQKISNTEQGVDELLHLKMMESLLDYTPSIMVLATGDANVSEYSSGFFKCVERALVRGWKVEVLSFKRSLNQLWLDKAFRKEWSGRFRTILLDDFTEELFDQ